MYLPRETVAAGLCMSKFWMDSKSRKNRKNGPPYIIVGNKALYNKKDVVEWMRKLSIKKIQSSL
jgi:hypothetical protein